jgi:hypothetical protein
MLYIAQHETVVVTYGSANSPACGAGMSSTAAVLDVLDVSKLSASDNIEEARRGG